MKIIFLTFWSKDSNFLLFNGLGFGEGGFRKHQNSNLVPKLIESSNDKTSQKDQLLPNPNYWFALL